MIKKISKQSGTAFRIGKNKFLKIIDPMGGQVSDLVFFYEQDTKEKISAGKTMDFEESILITKGNFLWSNRGRKLMEVIEDTNGRNDILLAPCSPETFRIMYSIEGYHPSCFENLYKNLASFSIQPDDIPTAFNIFMNVQFNDKGKLTVMPPTTKAGDFLIVKALDDLIIGLTACSAEDSNGGNFKPIHYEVLSYI
ncbi:MAG: urea carboxylase-associated family protein [Brumimicrobium sp.]